MIDAMSIEHHQYIDANLWFHRTPLHKLPRLLIIHNEHGVFLQQRRYAYSVSYSDWSLYPFDDWCEVCKLCGALVEVGSNYQCIKCFTGLVATQIKAYLEKEHPELLTPKSEVASPQNQ